MFYKLVCVRLQSMFVRKQKNNNKKNSKGSTILIAALLIYCLFTFGFLFGASYGQICEPICVTMNMEWFYFAISALLALMLGVIGSVMMTQSQIYRATDNELLLSMPIKPSYILGSRMVAIWLWTSLFSAVCIVPAGIVYFTTMPFDMIKLLIFVFEGLLIPFLSIAICLVMAWLLEVITSRMKNKNLFTIIGSLLFFAAYYAGINKMQEATIYLINQGEDIAVAIKKYFFPLYCYGVGISNKSFVDIIVFAATAIVPFLLMYMVISKTYIAIATTKRGGVKTKYVAKEMKVSSIQSAIIRKEVQRFISCPIYVINGGFGLLLQVALAVWVALKGRDIVYSMSDIDLSGLSQEMLSALIILAISILAFMVEISVSSISIEGKNLWVLKSFPIQTSDILEAKAKAHLYISAPFAIVCGIILNIFIVMTPICRIMAFILPLVAHCFVAYLGVTINLRFPKLDWISEAYAVKQSAAVLVATFGGLAVIVLLVILYIILSAVISSELFLVLVAIILITGTILIRAGMHRFGTKRYERL